MQYIPQPETIAVLSRNRTRPPNGACIDATWEGHRWPQSTEAFKGCDGTLQLGAHHALLPALYRIRESGPSPRKCAPNTGSSKVSDFGTKRTLRSPVLEIHHPAPRMMKMVLKRADPIASTVTRSQDWDGTGRATFDHSCFERGKLFAGIAVHHCVDQLPGGLAQSLL